ncbi:MAG: CRISPR-associated endonuclease Cas1 [Desulfobacteraceae bacterium]|nr:CRISPR-associated endonuclease Cas1 [Desulfobacteraceae bacterium]
MAYLYITEQNSCLRKTGDRLLVKKEEETLLDVQCHKIQGVLIFGNVQVTTQAVHELMEHDIELAILTRTGRLVGQLTSPATKNIELRLKQFRRYDDPGFCLSYAKALVAAKIGNSRNVVLAHTRNHPQPALTAAAEALERARQSTSQATALDALRGIEGTAARTYFGALAAMIRTDLPFEGRRKRPPTDPVNALLSLGYTMLFNELAALLDGLGFDPYLGYFHTVDYGRASLAADLMEPFRAPVTDRFTLNLLNLGMFKKGDFKENPRGGAIYLREEALKRYFAEYESFMNREHSGPAMEAGVTLRACMRHQAERLAAALRENHPFEPFCWGL